MSYRYLIKLCGVTTYKNGYNNIKRRNQNLKIYPKFDNNNYTEEELLIWCREKYGHVESIKILSINEIIKYERLTNNT